MPSGALASDTDGRIAFTVRGPAAAGNIAGEGNKDLIHVARIVGTVVQPAVALEKRVERPGRQDGKVYGRDPIVGFVDSTQATVVYRSFDGFGAAGGDGELGIATLDLTAAEPRWNLARDLTLDAERDLEIAAAVAPGAVIRTVRESSAGPAATGGLVLSDIALAPDPCIDRIQLRDPHTPPGEIAVGAVRLKNCGLRRGLQTSPGIVRVGTIAAGVFTEFAAIPVNLDLLPDETLEVPFSLYAPSASTVLRAVVETIPPGPLGSNDAAEVVLGVLHPLDLDCTLAATPGNVDLS
jgi:hypothetical protein